MSIEFTATARRLGVYSSAATAVLLAAYAVTLAVGLVSLESPGHPISDPMFSILEVLIIVMMPAMVVMMAAVHAWAPRPLKALSLVSVISDNDCTSSKNEREKEQYLDAKESS